MVQAYNWTIIWLWVFTTYTQVLGVLRNFTPLNKQPTGYTSTHIFLASYGSYTLHGSESGTGKMVMEPISPRSRSLSLCGVYSKCIIDGNILFPVVVPVPVPVPTPCSVHEPLWLYRVTVLCEWTVVWCHNDTMLDHGWLKLFTCRFKV